MAEVVNNLLNFWKSHNISLSTNDLSNLSVNYSYSPVGNAFTTSSVHEIPITEDETVWAKTASSPTQTSNTPNASEYRVKAYELNGLKADIEELEKNNNLTKKQKKALTKKKVAYNKGVKELRGMYSESFKGSIPDQIKLGKYQELEIPKQNKSKKATKKKTQTKATSAKKVSQQNQQLELDFGNSEITTNPTPNSKAEAEKSAEKSNETSKEKATENSVKEQKEVKPAEKAEKTKKATKSKAKSTKKGKLSKFFKKGRFGAILAGIALVGAAIAYVVNKAGEKVDKAKDVKAEKPVENTTQIEETPETVEPIQVAPVEASVPEESDSDVVTVKLGDTVWDLCEQKLKEWGNGNPTAKQIRELVDKVMADEENKLHWESDNYTVIIKPGQEVKIRKPEEYSS